MFYSNKHCVCSRVGVLTVVKSTVAHGYNVVLGTLNLFIFFSMAEAGTLTFDAWRINAELTEATVALLEENGFNSLKSCKLLNSALISKNFAKTLPLAQALLLQQAVESLQPSSSSIGVAKNPVASNASGNSHTSASVSVAPDLPASIDPAGITMASLLQMIGNGEKEKPTRSARVGQGNPEVFDPFMFGGNTEGTSPFRNIKDYVTLFQERSERTSVRLGDVELSLPEVKPKLQDISPLQYSEASLKILRDMVLKDGASLDQVMQYVGYLVKIANMGQRFHWKSVVKYDNEYRKAQAESNFVWGADNAFMMQVFLRERTNVNTPSSNSNTRHDAAKEVCGRFNSTRGCRWKYCSLWAR